MQRGTFQSMKSTNKSLILNKVRTGQPISRAQIAKETKLTPPTVSSIVKELMEEDLVIQSSLGESQGGRKPKLLLINHDAFCVIGVGAGPAFIQSIASNLAGKVLARSTPQKIKLPTEDSAFTDALINMVQSVMDQLPERVKIAGIGVAMHGVVDVEKGLSLVAPNLHLFNFPIRERLETVFDCQVKVENDVRAMALGESWLGKHDTPEKLLAVNLGSGVGAGLVIDGKLYHGATDLAGEVGHMTIDLHGDICTCGNRGCFQTFATEDAIVKRSARALAQTDSNEQVTENNEMKTEQSCDTVNLTSEMVYEQANRGEKRFINVLRETGEIIGVALTNLIHIINPDQIVLGGGVTKAEPFILPIIQETIQKRALTEAAKKTPVRVTEYGEDAALLGAVSLILMNIFSGENHTDAASQTV